MVDIKNIGYLSASKFTRLNAEKIKQLSPITILLNGDEPVCAVIQYETYLKMQDELTANALRNPLEFFNAGFSNK